MRSSFRHSHFEPLHLLVMPRSMPTVFKDVPDETAIDNVDKLVTS